MSEGRHDAVSLSMAVLAKITACFQKSTAVGNKETL